MWRDNDEVTAPGAVGAGLSIFDGRIEAGRQDGKANRQACEHAPRRTRPTVPGGAWTFPVWTISHFYVLSLSASGAAARPSMKAPPDRLGDALPASSAPPVARSVPRHTLIVPREHGAAAYAAQQLFEDGHLSAARRSLPAVERDHLPIL